MQPPPPKKQQQQQKSRQPYKHKQELTIIKTLLYQPNIVRSLSLNIPVTIGIPVFYHSDGSVESIIYNFYGQRCIPGHTRMGKFVIINLMIMPILRIVHVY